VTSSRGQSLALGDRLAVSLGTAKRLPSAKDSLLTPDARTSKAFSDGHTTTKYTFNIKGVLVFTSARKISEGKNTHCEFLHQLTLAHEGNS